MTKTLIILGGGIGSDNTLPLWVIDRCQYVIKQYKINKDINIICTSGGSYHIPNPLDEHNFVIHECDTICNYLIQNGIPSEIIYKEWTSYDTIGNAYFCKLLLIDTFKWYNIEVITSNFHFERSKIIFDFIFNDDKYKLKYVNCPFLGNHPDLDNRIKKEEKSIESLKKNIFSFKDNLNEFIYKHHQCYKSNPSKRKVYTKCMYN